MHLWELRDQIASSGAGDWHVLESGPYFHDSFEAFTDHRGRGLEHQRHQQRAVLYSDIDVSLEWGMTPDDHGYDLKDFRAYADALTSVREKTVRVRTIDVFYRGALVDRLPVHLIDGGRVYLPAPSENDDGWSVSGWHHDVVRLVDALRTSSQFDSYFSFTEWNVIR